MGVSRVCAVLATVVAAVAGLLVFTPAASAGVIQLLPRSSWSYADSRHPTSSLGGGNGTIPVGSWFDANGRKHTAKGYLRFDLSEFAGRTVQRATVVAAESKANNCDKPRATQVWTADPAGGTRWNHQPAEQTQLRLRGTVSDCVSDGISWDATAALQAAIDDGEESLRLAFRIAAEHQNKVGYGRRYNNDVYLFIESSGVPGVPTDLAVGNQDCTDGVIWNQGREPMLSAKLVLPDGGSGSMDFEVWPSANPADVTRFTSGNLPAGTARWSPAEGVVEHDVEYTWRARAKTDDAQSGWSNECRFLSDFVGPNKPLVSSSDYPDDGRPHGGDGVPGDFTFAPNGSDDVVGYYFGAQYPTEYIAVETPGEPVTASFTPEIDGPTQIYVESVDRAGNRSPETFYRFWVAATAPYVDGPYTAYLGQDFEVTFTPRLDDVVSYTYQQGDRPERTIEADADGHATVHLSLANQQDGELVVRSTSANGRVSGEGEFSLTVLDQPQVTSTEYPQDVPSGGPGVEGTFTFTSWNPATTRFGYCFTDTDTCGEVEADDSGRAQVRYTPSAAGLQILDVWMFNANGTRSETTWYFVYVNEG